jgi:hypothetical protein
MTEPTLGEALIFVAGSVWIVAFLATRLDGEENNVSKLLWALYLIFGVVGQVAYAFLHGLTGPATVFGVVYLLVLLSWGYKLDPEASIARDQWAEYRRQR